MKKFVTTIALLTAVATPAFAQGYNPFDRVGARAYRGDAASAYARANDRRELYGSEVTEWTASWHLRAELRARSPATNKFVSTTRGAKSATNER